MNNPNTVVALATLGLLFALAATVIAVVALLNVGGTTELHTGVGAAIGCAADHARGTLVQ